jgi:hypothetical protein
MSDQCWTWTWSKNRKGYGQFYFRGSIKLAHRVSWILHNGEIADGLYVCHTCDNPACVRPDHLFLGTLADNNRDMFSKGRAGILRGEDHPFAKMSDEIVRKIRESSDGGRAAARSFGVPWSTFKSIRSRKSWKHVA